MRKERFWYGIFMGATIITGMIGASTDNQIKAKGINYKEHYYYEQSNYVYSNQWNYTVDYCIHNNNQIEIDLNLTKSYCFADYSFGCCGGCL